MRGVGAVNFQGSWLRFSLEAKLRLKAQSLMRGADSFNVEACCLELGSKIILVVIFASSSSLPSSQYGWVFRLDDCAGAASSPAPLRHGGGPR